jgi:hypothetical protein
MKAIKKRALLYAVIARSVATKQSIFSASHLWIASRSLSSGGALRRPVGSQ